MKTALICGISGQDGAFLAKYLLEKNYHVVGTSRDAHSERFQNLNYLSLISRVDIETMALNDFRSVLSVLAKVEPDEVYNLAGQSSVGLSFEQPAETLESISNGTLNILESIRFLDKNIRFYNSGSSECFGTTTGPVTEDSSFSPQSPYAVAKACAANLLSSYRDAYELFACTGFLFNHESPIRPRRFVTRKIVEAAYKISTGEQTHLTLGDLDIYRDWGWAPDYVEAMWLMLQQEDPSDYIIATGKTVSLRYFVKRAFSEFGLDWETYVISDISLVRPSEIKYNAANIDKAAKELGWIAKHDVDEVIIKLCEAERARWNN